MAKTTRITIDLPPTLHKMLKIYSSTIGKSMKDIFINSVSKEIEENFKTNKNLSKCSNEELGGLLQNATRFVEDANLSEEEDDKILAPFLIEMAKRIENKTIKREGDLTSEEFFASLNS